LNPNGAQKKVKDRQHQDDEVQKQIFEGVTLQKAEAKQGKK